MMLCAQQDTMPGGSGRATSIPDVWDMVVLGRQGQPPLRFKGRRIAHLRRVVTPQITLFIDVWARRKGDFVIAYTHISGTDLGLDAHVMADVNDVADHLEMLCRHPLGPAQCGHVADTLLGMLRALALQKYFSILVGDFLSLFDTYCAPNECRSVAKGR